MNKSVALLLLKVLLKVKGFSLNILEPVQRFSIFPARGIGALVTMYKPKVSFANQYALSRCFQIVNLTDSKFHLRNSKSLYQSGQFLREYYLVSMWIPLVQKFLPFLFSLSSYCSMIK